MCKRVVCAKVVCERAGLPSNAVESWEQASMSMSCAQQASLAHRPCCHAWLRTEVCRN